MKQAVGLLETVGLTPALAALDRMEKSADVRVIQCELNDFCGVVVKVAGPVASVKTAVEEGRAVADQMGGQPVADVLSRIDPRAMTAVISPPETNGLIEQEVVFFPEYQVSGPSPAEQGKAMNQSTSLALGLIETQGFVAVFEAIDTACKAADVEVIGKEKLGGGYVTVVIRGDLSAVKAAIEAGKEKVEGLGKLIAAHVLARPSASVLALLPKG